MQELVCKQFPPQKLEEIREPSLINGGGTVTVSAADKKLPNLTILKRDAKTGDVIPNTNFEIRGIHYGYHNDVTTGEDGTVNCSPSSRQ